MNQGWKWPSVMAIIVNGWKRSLQEAKCIHHIPFPCVECSNWVSFLNKIYMYKRNAPFFLQNRCKDNIACDYAPVVIMERVIAGFFIDQTTCYVRNGCRCNSTGCGTQIQIMVQTLNPSKAIRLPMWQWHNTFKGNGTERTYRLLWGHERD